MRYAAFLRGINVGGKTQMKMEELRRVLTALGFSDVTTLLNSGNVVFDAAETDASTLTVVIESALETTFGRKTSVILRTACEIQSLVDADPFAGIEVTSETRLYVTFLGGTPADGQESSLKIPYVSPEQDVRVLRFADAAICSAITLSPQHGTIDLMAFLEDAFGKNLTTRNWNTLLKVSKSLGKSANGD